MQRFSCTWACTIDNCIRLNLNPYTLRNVFQINEKLCLFSQLNKTKIFLWLR